MATELTIRDQVKTGGDAASAFVAESNGRFERMIIRWLCEPIAQRMPASVRPNSISLVTHAVAWLTATCAIASPHLPRGWRALALLGASLGMLLSMIGDCLDGMHARRTNQCSKLGEMMDHWLDAIIVPLVTLGITFALEMEPWALVLVNVTATMVYHAQLVLYHHTGKFIHPDTANGVEAQFGVSIGYIALAALFWFVDRHAIWLDVAIGTVAVIGGLVQMRCNWFYYAKHSLRMLLDHLRFVGMVGGFGGLFLLGAIDGYAFALTLVFTSFRISGTYVLRTIIKAPFKGMDWGILAWLVAIAVFHLAHLQVEVGGVALQTLLPYAACVYMIGRNAVDFARHYRHLRPAQTA